MSDERSQWLWQGQVLRQKGKRSTWQTIGIEVYKDEIKCYRNKVRKNITHYFLIWSNWNVINEEIHKSDCSRWSCRLHPVRWPNDPHISSVGKYIDEAGFRIRPRESVTCCREGRNLVANLVKPSQTFIFIRCVIILGSSIRGLDRIRIRWAPACWREPGCPWNNYQ